MRKFVALVLFSALTLVLPSAASATTITLVNYNVTANTDPGLVVNVGANVQAPNTLLNLTVGVPSAPINLFTIGTAEGAMNADDLNPDTITANFFFDANPPAFGGSDSGNVAANGFLIPILNIPVCSPNPFACTGSLVWGPAVQFAFGIGGLLQVDLSDVTFPLDGRSDRGNSMVTGTFTLISDQAAPVPEPASMILLGTGLLYGAQRKWRRKV